MNPSKKILLVDDDLDYLALVERFTSALGYSFVAAPSALDAMKSLKNNTIEVMVTDLAMPTMDGMELLAYTKTHHPGVDVIVMTGYSKNYSYMDVIKAGASDFIAKPFNKDEYQAKLNRLFRERSLVADLRLATKKAGVASKAKSDFINVVSHELKTPMNAIIGFTRLLSTMEVTDNQREFLDIISVSSDSMMHLINQLLDFSMLDAGESDLQRAEFCLRTFFNNFSPSVEQLTSTKGISLQVAIDPNIPQEKLFGDSSILANILTHLISNAVKFSERGEIKVEVTVNKLLAADSIVLQFSVEDQGCGMQQDQIDYIYSPFTQVEEYTTRRHNGFGLGLAICSKLVKLLEGRIWADSDTTQGSTFFFTAKFGLVS